MLEPYSPFNLATKGESHGVGTGPAGLGAAGCPAAVGAAGLGFAGGPAAAAGVGGTGRGGASAGRSGGGLGGRRVSDRQTPPVKRVCVFEGAALRSPGSESVASCFDNPAATDGLV